MKKLFLLFIFLNSCALSNSWKLEHKLINKVSKSKESYLNNKCEIYRISFVRIDEMRNGIEIEFHFNRNDTSYMCIERYTNEYSFFDSVLKTKSGKIILKSSY